MLERDELAELLTVQRLLLHAVESVARGDELHVRVGVLVGDLAAETLLKLVLRHLDAARPKRNATFDMVVEAVITAGSAQDPPLDLRVVSRLHPLRNTRNCVMHDGSAQRADLAQSLLSQAQHALVKLTREVFGVDLLYLRLSEFVQDEKLRVLLQEAERKFAAGQFCNAAGLASAVVKWVLDRWGAFAANTALADARAVEPTILRLFATATSGVHLPDYRRFRETVAGSVAQITASMNPDDFLYLDTSWGHNRTPDQQREDAEFALEFAASLALVLEERIGAHGTSRVGISRAT